jgi:adenylate kinase family enzyme
MCVTHDASLARMRVYIVGGPGSGKSSLADALAARTGLEPLHLDDHWDRTFATDDRGAPTPEALTYRTQLVANVLQRSEWIVEGAEPPFVTALADAADIVVWCDIPFSVAAARMLRRHVRADLSGANAFPGYRRLFRFLLSVRRRYDAALDPAVPEWRKWTRAYVTRAIGPYRRKVIRSRGGERAARAVVSGLAQQRPPAR